MRKQEHAKNDTQPKLLVVSTLKTLIFLPFFLYWKEYGMIVLKDLYCDVLFELEKHMRQSIQEWTK